MHVTAGRPAHATPLDRNFLYWRRATETLDLALNPSLAPTKPPRKAIVETWLFPTEEDVHEEPDADETYDWPDLDPTLNVEQRVSRASLLLNVKITLTRENDAGCREIHHLGTAHDTFPHFWTARNWQDKDIGA